MPLQQQETTSRRQVVTRNTRPDVVVLSSDPKGTEYVEWQPAGDPNGGDIQVVPESIANLVSFLRLKQRGIVVEIDGEGSEVYETAVAAQNAAFDRRTSGAAKDSSDVMDPEAKNDLLSMPCVGPDSRGQGRCGVEVPVREATKDERPPLCPQHEPLASQYVPMQEQEGTAQVTKWTRVTLGAREQQQT